MPINNALYRELYKNARMLVILKLIFDLGGCATVVQLARLLGVHREGVSDNVYRLADRALISRPHERSGWFITRLGMEFLKPSPQLMPEKPALMPEKPAFVLEKPSLALNTTITTLNIERSTEAEGGEESFKNLVLEKPALVPEKPAIVLEKPAFEGEVWLAFSKIGISHNPTSEKVSRIPGLTYDGVIKKWEELISIGKPWPGLLLQILPNLPPRELRGHSKNCHCTDCRADHDQLIEQRAKRRLYGEWNDHE